MTDLFGAFARGHQQGDELGGRMAARGLRRRVEEAESQFRSGAINADQYEAAIREAQGQGMARFRDTEDVATGLRTRAFEDLNRRDARGATQAMLDGRYDDSAAGAGSIAARNGDMAQGLATRRWMNDLDAGKLVRDIPGGGRDYTQARDAQARSDAALGDIDGAEKRTSQGFQAMEAVAAKLAQHAHTQLKAGNRDGFLAATNRMLELRGIPAQVREGTNDVWQFVTEDGQQKEIRSEREMLSVLYQIGQGNASALTDSLGEYAEADSSARKRYSDFEAKAFDATMDIAKNWNLSSDTQRLLASSLGRMSGGNGGVQNITKADDGSLLLTINGQLVRGVPPGQQNNPDDPDSAVTTQWIFTDARDPSKPVGVSDEVEDNIGEYALALAQAQEEAGNEQSFLELQTRLSTVWDTFHQITGGQGRSPLTTGFMRANSRLDPEEAEGAIGDFMGVFGKLEGTGDNGRSTAIGVGQFTDDTALDVARSNFPDDPVTQQIMATMRDPDNYDKAAMQRIKAENPEFMQKLTREYAMENAEKLANRRLPVNAMTLYAMHHFGPGGGPKFLRAFAENPDASVKGVLSEEAIRDNPYVVDNPRVANPGTLRGVIQDWYRRQPAMFDSFTPEQIEDYTAAAAPTEPDAAKLEATAAAPAPTGPDAAQDDATAISALQSAAARGQAYTEAVRQIDEVIAKYEEANVAPLQRRAPITAGGMAPMYAAGDVPQPGLTAEQRAELTELRATRDRYAKLAEQETTMGRRETRETSAAAAANALSGGARGILQRYPKGDGAR